MEKFDNKTVISKLFYSSFIVCYLVTSCDIIQNEYECSNGNCIPGYYSCDGNKDCQDGGDELEAFCRVKVLLACGVSQNEFECSDGTCVPEFVVCDTNDDCPDGGEELEVACQKAGKPYIPKEKETTKHTTTNMFNIPIVEISTASNSRTIDRTTEQSNSLTSTNEAYVSESGQMTSIDVCINQENIQEQLDFKTVQMENEKYSLYGIIAGSTTAAMIGIWLMVGAGIFLKYRHHKQRLRRIKVLPLKHIYRTR